MQSSLHSWDSTNERPSANDCGYSFVSPAEKGLWYQSWSLDAGNVGGQVSDRLVGGHSSYLLMTQPTDKPASRSSPTILVLSSTCLHCRGTVADALLGMLVSLLDSISSDFVFGPIGTEGRPAGALSVEMLDRLDVGQLLSCAERHRWHQVLSVWHVAGWRPSALQVVTAELRPLSYGCGLSLMDLAGVPAQQIDHCITQYCHVCGYGPDELESFQDFFSVLKQQFASSSNIFLPAEDIFERLSKVAVSDVSMHC